MPQTVISRCRQIANGRKCAVAAAALLILWTAPYPAACAAEKKVTSDILVVTDPDKATIYVDRVAQGMSPATIAARAGAHLVVARKQGYVEARKTVVVEPNNVPITVEMKLEPETGLVLLYSQPAGVDVVINDVNKGKTPVLITELPYGNYRVHFSKAGFSAVEKAFTVGGRSPMKVQAVLQSEFGTIAFTSDPPGAEVTVNGGAWGQTPCTASGLKPGNCEIVVHKDGFQPYKKTVTLAAGEQADVAAALKPAPGSLVVHSIPENAIVYVNNERRGNTPLILENLEPGEYRVRTELPGCEPLARTVTIGQAGQAIEEFRLELNTGMIEIKTHPTGVRVVVDGEDKGLTTPESKDTEAASDPMKIEALTPGAHTLKLSKPGYETKTIKADVAKGVAAKLAARLRQRVSLRIGTGRNDVRIGLIEERLDNGDIKLEVQQGVIRIFKKADILSCEPVLEDSDPSR